jgi:hypothetical protein
VNTWSLSAGRAALTAASGAPALLFVRAVPVEAASTALGRLRRSCPGARIVVLTSNAGRDRLAPLGLADDFVAYRPARFGLLAAGLRVIRALHRQRFDRVIVPYVGDRRDYANVARLARAVAGPNAVWLDCGPGADPVAIERSGAIGWREALGGAAAPLGRHWLYSLARFVCLAAATAAAMAILSILAVVLLALVALRPDRTGGDGHSTSGAPS